MPLLWSILIVTVLVGKACSQCDYFTPDGTYRAAWYFDQSTSDIRFLLQVNQRLRKSYWTGIGFGNQMRGGDMIIIMVNDNKIDISDSASGSGDMTLSVHATDNKEPIVDKQQDAKNFTGRLIDGILTAEFSRSVHTSDKDDLDLMDKQKNFCQDFMFPLGAGALNVESEDKVSLFKHFQIPVVKRMCNIDQCGFPTEPPPPPPPQPETTAGISSTVVSVPPLSQSTEVRIPSSGILPEAPPTPVNTPAINNNVQEVEFTTRLIPAPTQSSAENPQFTTSSLHKVLPVDRPQLEESSRGHQTGMCTFSEGDYDIKWLYNNVTQTVTFSLDAMLSLNKWTGVGFGRTMQPGDMIILYDRNGLVDISDRHSNGRQEPQMDQRQDVQVAGVSYNGHRVQAQFSRRVNTGDFEDIPLEDPSLNGCQYFMFPITGGSTLPAAGGSGGPSRLNKHIGVPRIKLVCDISKCLPGTLETVVPVAVPVAVPQAQPTPAPVQKTILQSVPPLLPVPPQRPASLPEPVPQLVPQVLPQLVPQQAVSQLLPQQSASLQFGQNQAVPPQSPQFVPQQQQQQQQQLQQQLQPPKPIAQQQPVPSQPLLTIPPLPAPATAEPEILNRNLAANGGGGVRQQQNFVAGQIGATLGPLNFPPPPVENPSLPTTVSVPPLVFTAQPPLRAKFDVANVGVSSQPPISVPALPGNPVLVPQSFVPETPRSPQCPVREDHTACKFYIDDYFGLVYAQFPRIEQITQKACVILQEHQEGIVYSECCHYLTSICNGFIK